MLSEEQVAKVAHLARLSLSPEETKLLTTQLASVLNAFEDVAKVPTEGVEALVTPTDMAEHWREDEAQRADSAAGAMKNAPEAVGNLFKVPPVVG